MTASRIVERVLAVIAQRGAYPAGDPLGVLVEAGSIKRGDTLDPWGNPYTAFVVGNGSVAVLRMRSNEETGIDIDDVCAAAPEPAPREQ